LPALFEIVKSRDAVPPTGTVAALNSIAMDGGESTVRVAVAELPESPGLANRSPVVFVHVPRAVAVTLIENVQLEPGSSHVLMRWTADEPSPRLSIRGRSR